MIKTITNTLLIQKGDKIIEVINNRTKINSFYSFKAFIDPLTIFIKNKYFIRNNINNVSCRKKSTDYLNETGIKFQIQ